MFWVYILECENKSYYTGYTVDLNKRYQEHCLGTIKCKYTRSFKPICIAQSWQIEGDKAVALKIEWFIKKLSKSQKKQLIDDPQSLSLYFPQIKFMT